MHILDKKGYFELKNLLSHTEKKKIIDIIFSTYSKYLNLDKKNFSVQSQKFHNELLKFRFKNPDKFGEIYDQLKLNAQLKSIFYSRKFLKIFSKILDNKDNKIYLNGIVLRLDAPNDKKNALDWHQDSPHYLMTYPKMNAGVCWISITKNSKNNGSLIFIPDSHKEFIKNVKKTKKNKSISESLKIKISKNEIKKSKNLNQSFGDAAFLHMNLKHRSGTNNSKKFRITLACRFHSIDDNFNTGKEIYKYNKIDEKQILSG